MTSQAHSAAPGPQERLVEAYLADLERALRDLDADEREEVVASVREHIDAALSEHDGEPTPRDVETVLQQLGSVEQIAQDAGDGVSRSGGGTQDARSREGWLLLALAVASLVLLVIPLVALPLALGVAMASAIRMRGSRGPARLRYGIAAALSGLALLITLFLALALLTVTTTGPTQTGPEAGTPLEGQPTVPAPPASGG